MHIYECSEVIREEQYFSSVSLMQRNEFEIETIVRRHFAISCNLAPSASSISRAPGGDR